MDVDTIAPGLDFAEVITEAVSTCEVLLAVIGPRWLDAKDEAGQRRLEAPDDLTKLARRNALSLRHESFRSDADRLLAAIEPLLRPPAAAAPAASGPAQVVSGAVLPTDVVPRPGTVLVLRHDDNVNWVAFSPDGRLLATASYDDSARLWALVQ